MTHFESIDIQKLNIILNHQDVFKAYMNPDKFEGDYAFSFETLRKYADLYDEEITAIPVSYKQQSLNKNFKTRKFVKNGLGLQALPRLIRGTIAKDYYKDIDMVNAHPVILAHLCEVYNDPNSADDLEEDEEVDEIDYRYLSLYNSNRNKTIDEIVKINPELTFDEVKIAILALINGGYSKVKVIKHKTQWLEGFTKEIRKILITFWNYHTDLHADVKAKRSDKFYNLEASLMNQLLCNFENLILECMVKKLKALKIIDKNYVMIFDGMMIPRNKLRSEDYTQKILRDIENHIYKKLNIRLTLAVKDMETFDNIDGFDTTIWTANSLESKHVSDADLSADDEPLFSDEEDATYDPEPRQKHTDLSAVSGHKSTSAYFNIKDTFYWRDFLNELTNKKWKSLEDIKHYCKNNIKRVMFRLENGNMFVKLDDENPFYNLLELPRDLIQYTKIEQVKFRGRTIEHEEKVVINFKKLYDTEIINYVPRYNNIIVAPKPPTFSQEDIMEQNRTDADFNVWTGHQATLLPKEEVDAKRIEKITKHIMDVWAAGDETNYKYIMTWFKDLFTNPQSKNRVAMGFYSKEHQIGKSIVIHEFMIPYILGNKLCLVEDGLKFVGERFNTRLMNKQLIVCEELNNSDSSASSYHNTFDTLKNLITSPTIMVEWKGGSKITVADFSNYIFFTNNPYALKIEQHDARYFITECDGKYQGDFKYFKDLTDTFNQENANHFYSYCYYGMFMDDGEEQIEIRNIPNTNLRKQIKISCLSSPLRFLHRLTEIMEEIKTTDAFEHSSDLLLDVYDCTTWENKFINECQDNDKEIKAANLYNYYKAYCAAENERALSNTKFGRDVIDKINKRKTNGIFVYSINTIKTI